MRPDEVATLIRAALPQAEVDVRSPDDHHFEAVVVCDAFAGLPTLRRHRMVYEALGDLVGRELHALSLRTLTPGERDGSG